MKEREDILNTEDLVKWIKSYQIVSDEQIAEYKKAFDVKKHAVFERPLKIPTVTYENDKKELCYKDGTPYEPNKIGDPLANEIVEKAISFVAGNKPEISYDSDNQKKIDALLNILDENKELALNSDVCESLFAFSEVAEIWYYDVNEDTQKGKIRFHLASPLYGDILYPIIDRKRKMIGFAYSNTHLDGDKEVEELVYYTKKYTYVFEKRDSKWVQRERPNNIYNKITIVYTNQGKSEYEDVLPSIYRLETTYSNAGDSVDRTAYPDKVIKGKIAGISYVPGENSVYEIAGDGEVKYVESGQATSLLEFDTNINEAIVRKRTQTPDISLESLTGLGNISGEMLERLLVEPILKARRKITKYLIKHHQRRMNILNVMVSHHGNWDVNDIKFSIDIEPYVPQDTNAKLDRLRKLLGLMPTRYIIEQYKKHIDPSIDIEEIMQMFEEEKVKDAGGEL